MEGLVRHVVKKGHIFNERCIGIIYSRSGIYEIYSE